MVGRWYEDGVGNMRRVPSRKAAFDHHYGREGVMPDYTSLTGPDYEAAVRDNVWSDREQLQRIENIMRKHEWKERLRYR